jgi:hypothetical protein
LTRIIALVLLGAFLCSNALLAGTLDYNFSFIPEPPFSGTIEPFSFTVTSPTYIDGPGPLSFAPFSFTDGADVWTMTEGAVNLYRLDPADPIPGACFEFATGTFTWIPDLCQGLYPPANGGTLEFFFPQFPVDSGATIVDGAYGLTENRGQLWPGNRDAHDL